jgi:hypothetical protein
MRTRTTAILRQYACLRVVLCTHHQKENSTPTGALDPRSPSTKSLASGHNFRTQPVGRRRRLVRLLAEFA